VTPGRPSPGTQQPVHTIQRLVMGDERLDAIMAAALVNQQEDRIGMVLAAAIAVDA
jgi:hypothetical protein